MAKQSRTLDMRNFAEHVLGGRSDEEARALLDALLSARAGFTDDFDQHPDPVLAPIPTEVRGFRVRLDLNGAKPPIWRRLEILGNLNLAQLHDVIQVAMGWEDSHLHRFRTGATYDSPYFVTAFDIEEGDHGVLEDDVRLDQLLITKDDRLWYEYDFGDNWHHTLKLEEILETPPPRARCITGKLACPPEDCGAMWGYEELATWVRSGYDESLRPDVFDDAEDARKWLPENWHPDHFDIDKVNAALKKL